MKLPIALSRLVSAGAGLTFAAAAAAQQDYPNRPLRFIAPNAPGGATTIVARLIGDKLTHAWGQQVIVDNRPGGNNIVAGETLQRAAADGHTILLVTAAHAINPSAHPHPIYKEFLGLPAVASLASTEYPIIKSQGLPDFREKLALQGVEPFINGPDKFAALIKSELVAFAKVIKAANIKLEN